MQALTRKQHAQAPEIGIVASPRSAVAVASSRQRMPSATCAQATSVAPSSARPSISRSATPNRRPSCRAAPGSPPARCRPRRGRRSPRGRQASRAQARARAGRAGDARAQPAGRDGGRAMEIELIGRQPGGHPGRARGVPALPVEAVGALARREHRLRVVEPPGRPAQSFERLGRLPVAERDLEHRPCLGPTSVPKLHPASVQPGRRGLVGFLGHARAFSHAPAALLGHAAADSPEYPRMSLDLGTRTRLVPNQLMLAGAFGDLELPAERHARKSMTCSRNRSGAVFIATCCWPGITVSFDSEMDSCRRRVGSTRNGRACHRPRAGA